MFNFENLHKNKKFAFLDGVLCGLTIAYLVNEFYKDYQEMKELKRLAEESINKNSSI